jgi:lysophospholipase L1-like esterase
MKISPNKKLNILKTVYLILVGIIITGLCCEMYFVIGRRWSRNRVIEYGKNRGGIYAVQLLVIGYVESLWEVKDKKYKANASLVKTIGEDRYVIKTNSQGFRNKEFEIKKPKNVYRIICIGASTTFQGRTNDDTYPALLENQLRRKYPDLNIEVLNFGISGTFSDHWLNEPEKLFKFQPNLIIQYNAVNDISWRHMTWHNNACVNKIWYLWRRGLNLSFLLQKIFPPDASLLDNCFISTLQNFQKMGAEAKSRGIDYIVGSFATPDYNLASEPFKEYLDYIVQKVSGRALNLKYYSSYYDFLSRYNKLFHLYVGQNNLTAVFVDESISHPDLFVDVCHMTPEGIEKLADTFYEGVSKIIDKKLVLIKG